MQVEYSPPIPFIKNNHKIQWGKYLLRPGFWILSTQKQGIIFRIAKEIALFVLIPLSLLGRALIYWGEKTYSDIPDTESLKKLKSNPNLYVGKLYYPVIRRELLSQKPVISQDEIFEIENLPSEIIPLIFTHILEGNRTKIDVREDLAAISCVSKKWHRLARKARKAWLDNKRLSPRVLGCRDIQESIQAITNLQTLHGKLAFAAISQDQVNTLTKQTSLVSLNIFLTKECQTIPLTSLRNLNSLTLYYHPVDSDFLRFQEKDLADALPSLPLLRKLHIKRSGFTGEYLRESSSLSALKNLSLQDCRMITTDNLSAILFQLQDIEEINLYNTNITFAHLTQLPREQLKKVCLACSLEEQEIADFLSSCSQLRHLRLNCYSFKGILLSKVLPSLKNLTQFDCYYGKQLDPVFYTALSTLTHLEKLTLHPCANLPSTITSLTSLVKLSTLKCTHESICQVLPFFKSLTKLDLTHPELSNTKPTIDKYRVVAQLTHLTSLGFSGGKEWNSILSGLTSLKSLKIQNHRKLPSLIHLTRLKKLYLRYLADKNDIKDVLAHPSLAELQIHHYTTKDSKPEQLVQFITSD